MKKKAKKAKKASIQLAAVKTDVKNAALAEIAKALKQNTAKIISANIKDLAAAEKDKVSPPLTSLCEISPLCLKSGNPVLLKGGSEAANTNKILAKVIAEAAPVLPEGWIQLLETRQEVAELLKKNEEHD